jgi:DNA-binding NtrC family response regulator
MDSPGGPVRVLLVDDEQRVDETAATYLERERSLIDVVTETSASAGLDVLADEPVDCVVSDYDMPETDGPAFLDRVPEGYGDLPLVLFTGEGPEDLAGAAIAAGVTDYRRKGTGTEQYAVLANRIERVVEATGRRRRWPSEPSARRR